jgi:hypothetical protein
MDACVRQVTVPASMKQVWSPDANGESTVCCTETTCTKTFESKETFELELSIYQRNLPYIPPLVAFDRDTLSIQMKRVGEPLGSLWDSGVPTSMLFNIFHSRNRFKKRVRKLHKRFRKDTGYFHNDITWKNVLRDPYDRLYLIDFENAAHTMKILGAQNDPDDILAGHLHLKMWIIIAVILCTAIVSVRLMQKTNVLFSKKMKGVILAMVVGCIVITSIIEQHAQSQSTKGINDVTWKNPDRDS